MEFQNINIVEKSKGSYVAHFGLEYYVDVQYVGWTQKGMKNYKTQIWREECGCIFDEIMRFPNIGEAISFVREKIKSTPE